MNDTLRRSNIMLLFCTKNTMKSEPVKKEWQATFHQTKKGVMRVIPVYDNIENVEDEDLSSFSSEVS